MLKNILIVIYTVTFFFSGCKSDYNKKQLIRRSDRFEKFGINDSITKVGNIGDYIDSIKYINIETSSEFLINSIRRIEIVDDKIIVYDKKGHSVLVFDSDGKFLNKIGKKGKKVGEYDYIRCITVDKINKTVMLFDPMQMAVLKYNVNGEYIGKEDYDRMSAWAFYPMKDKIYFYQNNTKYYQNKYNILSFANGQIINRFLPFIKELKPWYDQLHVFYTLNNENNLFYIDKWNSQVLEISDSVRIKYKIDFGKTQLPMRFTLDMKVFNENNANYTYLMSFLENETWAYIPYNSFRSIKNCFYYKKEKLLFNYVPEYSIEEAKNIVPFKFFLPIYTDDNYFVSVINTKDCYYINEMYPDIKDTAFVNATKNVGLEDNPVLAFYYFKQN